MEWIARSMELVWAASLAAVPVALLAAACSRLKRLRPATRHALWFAVLTTLLSPLFIGIGRPSWFRSERVLAAADSAADAVYRSATSAKSAYMALAPFAGPPVSTLDDLPDEAVLPPTYRLAPPVRSAGRESGDVRAVDRAAGGLVAGPIITPDPFTSSMLAKTRPAYAEAPTTHILNSPSPPQASTPKPVARERATFLAESKPAEAAPSDPELPVAAASPSTFTQFREWLRHLLTVRDTIAAVPAFPPIIWLGGAGLIAALWSLRIFQVRRMLRRAEPAPEPLLALVRRLSRVAGLKRAPETLVVNDRISPMIWCGVRPRLVIPRELWGELDSRCQCAVIMHELSHLRRRDHIVCLLQSFIGLLYWWHPIAWWARARLRDEAEACCDAWVTTLLPGGRRAYAEALVATKSFLSVPGRSGAPGLSVVSGRTRLLARRISMVMTQRVAPRASFLGLAFALSVGAAGIFVMPGLACPPEDEKPSGQATKVVGKDNSAKKAEKTAKAKVEAKAAEQAARGRASAPQAFFGEAPALEAMRAPQPEQPGHMNQLQDMERSLQQMEQRLQEMQRHLESMQRPRSQGSGSSSSPFSAATAPRAVAGTRALGGLTTATAPRATTNASPVIAIAPRAGMMLDTAPKSNAIETRSYSLPKGKLDALVALMARDDVPIVISSDGDSITVNATSQQHRVFQSFVNMINPGPRGDAGQNNELNQALMNDHSAYEQALHQRALAAELAAHEHAVAAQHMNVHRDAIRAQTDQLRAQARSLAAQKSSTQRQSEQVRRQIERVKQNAEKARERARKAGNEAEADRVEEAMDREIEALESQIECIDSSCDSIDCQIESIEEAIESLTKAAADVEEARAASPATPIAPASAVAPVAATAPAAPSAPAAPAAPAGTPAPAAAPASPAPSMPAVPAAPPALTTAGSIATPAPAAPAAR